MIKEQYIDWPEIHNAVSWLGDLVKPYGPESIIAISRGGLIPARLLADYLNIRRIYSIGVEFYTNIGETKEHPFVYQDIPEGFSDMRFCIVEDIVDSGRSMSLVRRHLQERNSFYYQTCAIHLKPNGFFEPTFTYMPVEKDTWIIYPWETHEHADLQYNNRVSETLIS